MNCIMVTWTENGKTHYVTTDKVTVTVDENGDMWYTCKQLVTNKEYRVKREDSWLSNDWLNIGD